MKVSHKGYQEGAHGQIVPVYGVPAWRRPNEDGAPFHVVCARVEAALTAPMRRVFDRWCTEHRLVLDAFSDLMVFGRCVMFVDAHGWRVLDPATSIQPLALVQR